MWCFRYVEEELESCSCSSSRHCFLGSTLTHAPTERFPIPDPPEESVCESLYSCVLSWYTHRTQVFLSHFFCSSRAVVHTATVCSRWKCAHEKSAANSAPFIVVCWVPTTTSATIRTSENVNIEKAKGRAVVKRKEKPAPNTKATAAAPKVVWILFFKFIY